MKLPIAWLRDYLDLGDATAEELAARLALAGFPVDAIERRPELTRVVVGRLTAVEKHPNADRLAVCTVDVGGEAPLTIATAATNVAVGDVVPVARIGARLVGMEIAPRKMRGIASEGMLCSAAEIGLPGDWFEDGILQLERDAPPGADAVARYGLGDAVLDVEITANRPDAMSVLGLARELGAALGRPVREPATARTRPDVGLTPADAVVLKSPDAPRFVAQRIAAIPGCPAPFPMRLRLALADQRPIDAIVDVTNFVMLEGGQPLHAYDADALAGGLVVRDALPGEMVTTLDGGERALDARYLVVADAAGIACVAGLMGAARTEVRPQTRAIVLESATFLGPRIRRASVALGLRTEASSRHEKTLPGALARWGAARAAVLFEGLGAEISAPVLVGSPVEEPAPVRLPLARIAGLLGIEVAADEALAALGALGFSADLEGDVLVATPPGWRGDVRLPEDVVEEIARVVGYDRIPAVMPPVLPHAISSAAYERERRVADVLAARGYRENVSLALVSGGAATAYARAGIALPSAPVEIGNPLSDEQRYLRFSLVPGLLANAERHAAEVPFRSFELGHVFEHVPDADPSERGEATWLLVTAAVDEPDWRDGGFALFAGESVAIVRALCGRTPDAVRATEPGLHPGKTAALVLDGRTVTTIGALDPRLGAALGTGRRAYVGRLVLAQLPPRVRPAYVAGSRYPAITRDLAVVVAQGLEAAALVAAAREAQTPLLASVRVVDEYRGAQLPPDAKGLTVRLVLQRSDATLTDADAEAGVRAVLDALAARCSARLRT